MQKLTTKLGLLASFILFSVLSYGQFIAPISVGNITDTGATITWTTCTPSNTAVNYGTTSSYGKVASTANSVTSHSQVLSGLTSGVTYHYRVVSADVNGVTVRSSDKTFATKNTAPVVTANPQSSTYSAGMTASFTSTASGVPTPTIQWQSSIDGGSIWNNISGATSTTYSFTTSSTQNGNEYRAVFTNSVGSVTSLPATLTVTSTSSLYGLSVSDASNRTTNVRTLQGATLTGNEYIFTSPIGSTASNPTGITKVDYSLDGVAVGTDYVTPFDYSNTTSAIVAAGSCGSGGPGGTTKACTLSSSAAAGTSLIASVMYANGQTVNSVVDTQGNVYTPLAACAGSSYSVRTYYVKSVIGGADTVTATMSATSPFIQLNVQNYSGINGPPSIDKNACGSPTSAGPVSTLFGKELIFVSAVCVGTCTPGTGYTSRSSLLGNIIEDQTITANGSYSGTIAPVGGALEIQMSTYPATTTVAALNTSALSVGTHSITQTVTEVGGGTEVDTATFTISGSTTAHSVTLNWTAGAATNLPITFSVYRGTASGAETRLVQSLSSGTTTYVDSSTALTSGTRYYYYVTETDSTLVESAPSNEVSALIP